MVCNLPGKNDLTWWWFGNKICQTQTKDRWGLKNHFFSVFDSAYKATWVLSYSHQISRGWLDPGVINCSKSSSGCERYSDLRRYASWSWPNGERDTADLQPSIKMLLCLEGVRTDVDDLEYLYHFKSHGLEWPSCDLRVLWSVLQLYWTGKHSAPLGLWETWLKTRGYSFVHRLVSSPERQVLGLHSFCFFCIITLYERLEKANVTVVHSQPTWLKKTLAWRAHQPSILIWLNKTKISWSPEIMVTSDLYIRVYACIE